MTMHEQWKKIPGFANYEISNLGSIEKIGKTKRIPIKVVSSNTYVYASLSYAPYRSKQINVKAILDELFDEHIYRDHSVGDLPGEIWKDIVGWENSYQVSSYGRIRTKQRQRSSKQGSVARIGIKIKETYLDGDGYERVSLYEDNRTKLLGVHRVVAEAFVPNPHKLPQVNHINGNKADNRPDNLEWVTNTANIRHSIETGLRDPNRCKIQVIRLEDNKQFDSIAELHREIGGSYNEIVHLLKVAESVACIRGQHYKYAFKE